MNDTEQEHTSSRRTRIKVCGITRLEDALDAVRFGADAIGFVFYEKSPRYIQPEEAQKIILQLPPFVTITALFVNPQQSDIDNILTKCAIDVIQLHGDETPEFCSNQSRRVIKAVAIDKADDLKRISDYSCTVLLDAKAPTGIYGGTGESFEWSLLDDLNHSYPLILAGGLQQTNIVDALALYSWFAVDVSSGVEQSKGIKDKHKMFDFCKTVHEYDCKV